MLNVLLIPVRERTCLLMGEPAQRQLISFHNPEIMFDVQSATRVPASVCISDVGLSGKLALHGL